MEEIEMGVGIELFLGAVFAFFSAFWLYSYQKRAQEAHYLAFLITYIASQTSKLYACKKDFVKPRDTEITNLENALQTLDPNQPISLNIRELSQFISNYIHSSANIDIEKLSFLADFEPNLITLTKAALDADADVNQIIEACNNQIKETKAELSLANIWMLIQVNKSLSDQIDFALALLEHAQLQLVKFSQAEFKHFTNIKGVELESSYVQYRPSIKNSFLKIDYVPKETTYKNKVLKIINRLRTCF